MRYDEHSVCYLDKSITPIKQRLRYVVCELGERILRFTATTASTKGGDSVAIFLARTSAAKTSCRAAKLLSKIQSYLTLFISHVRSYIYPPILYTCNLTSDFHLRR